MVFITTKSPLGAMFSPCSNHVAQIHIGFPAFLQFGGPFGAVGLLGLPNCCPGHGLVTSSCHILLYGERVPPGKLNMNFKMDTVSETRIDISHVPYLFSKHHVAYLGNPMLKSEGYAPVISMLFAFVNNLLVVSTHLTHISQIGSFPQVGAKIKST